MVSVSKNVSVTKGEESLSLTDIQTAGLRCCHGTSSLNLYQRRGISFQGYNDRNDDHFEMHMPSKYMS